MHQNIEKSLGGFILWLAVLGCIFGLTLFRLATYAVRSDLYSYTLLVPIIVGYLIWLKRKPLMMEIRGKSAPGDVTTAGKTPGTALLIVGIICAIGYLVGLKKSLATSEDLLALSVLSFLCLLISGGFFFLGKRVMAMAAFPIGFLVFMVPFPTFVTDWFEVFLQHSSANAASAFLSLSDATVFREGLLFRLPGITIQVAKECSGIRSSLVLFITSLLTGYLFLGTPWKRAALTLAVIPLAILRNGFRIFTIAMLCVHVDPKMIDSPIHHRGGPIFFVLSLVPFLALLFVLRRSERTKNIPVSVIAGSPGKEPLPDLIHPQQPQ